MGKSHDVHWVSINENVTVCGRAPSSVSVAWLNKSQVTCTDCNAAIVAKALEKNVDQFLAEQLKRADQPALFPKLVNKPQPVIHGEYGGVDDPTKTLCGVALYATLADVKVGTRDRVTCEECNAIIVARELAKKTQPTSITLPDGQHMNLEEGETVTAVTKGGVTYTLLRQNEDGTLDWKRT